MTYYTICQLKLNINMGESGTIENPMGGINICTVFYFAFCVSPLCLGIGIMIRLEITISTNSGVQHTMENWTIIKRLVQRMFFFLNRSHLLKCFCTGRTLCCFAVEGRQGNHSAAARSKIQRQIIAKLVWYHWRK